MGHRLGRDRRAHPCSAGAWRAHRRDRHDQPPAPRKRRGRDRRSHTVRRRDAALHPARLPVQGGRPVADQLSPAALDFVHAGRGADRTRPHEDRLRACGLGRLPVFLVRRRVSDRAADMNLGFEVLAHDGAARAGRLSTAHGVVETPAFMPVGTAATVKAMTQEGVAATGARLLLGNTYHLMLRPGAERVAALGGLHRFMNWPHAILTDSGGFQVMSLAKLRKISDEGVRFRSHIDGSEYFLSPARAMEIQHLLGSDIQMVLDECPAYPASKADIEKSLAMTTRWAKRSREAFGEQPGRACFGIVQGGVFADLRQRSAESLIEIGFDGYACGGLAVGEEQSAMFETLDA